MRDSHLLGASITGPDSGYQKNVESTKILPCYTLHDTELQQKSHEKC